MALTDKLTAIGDAIREKTGSADLIPLSDMPNEIDAVYRKGAQSEHDAFWDAFQIRNNELRTSYEAAFQSWRHPCFTPKYDIILAGPYNTQAFRQAQGFDLYDMIVGRGLTFDTSGATALTRTFNQSAIGKIPPLDLSSCTSLTSTFEAMGRMFGYTTTTLVLNNLREDCTFNRTFYDALYFENITITGTIGQNGFDVSSCSLLNRASITSIINALSDTATGKTVTLSEAAVENAFDSTEGEAAEISLSEKQSDGFYTVTFGSSEDAWCILQFAVPMDVSFHGGFLADSDIYEADISRTGVYRLNMLEDVTATAPSGETLALELYDLLSDGGALKIKRTDGKDLSLTNISAYKIGEYNYTWFELIATKPNWNIALM